MTAIMKMPEAAGVMIRQPSPWPEDVPHIPHTRVYICSPLRGNIVRNLKRAAFFCNTAFNRGYHPWAPHLFYGQFLDDTDEYARAAGLRYGQESMWQCAELWVCGGGKITEGMKSEIDLALQLGIPVRYFDGGMAEV
jgi:hypothetical protein